MNSNVRLLNPAGDKDLAAGVAGFVVKTYG